MGPTGGERKKLEGALKGGGETEEAGSEGKKKRRKACARKLKVKQKSQGTVPKLGGRWGGNAGPGGNKGHL